MITIFAFKKIFKLLGRLRYKHSQDIGILSRKLHKRHLDGKGRSKTICSQMTWSVYRKSESTKKKNENNQTVNKINEFKVVEYKINIQYSVLVLYTSNEWYEVKLRNSCFYNRIKRILKCLRINLTKEVQNTKTAKKFNTRSAVHKNCKTLLKWITPK